LPGDPAHPTLDDAPRVLIDRHTIQLHHDVRDEYEDVTVTATYVLNGLTGEQIELGCSAPGSPGTVPRSTSMPPRPSNWNGCHTWQAR
jgi:hypothetical protein